MFIVVINMSGSIEELALKSEDVKAVGGDQIGDVVDYTSKHYAVWGSIFKPIYLTQGHRRIKLPTGSETIIFEQITEGNSVSTENNYTYSGKTVNLHQKYGSKIYVNYEAYETTDRNLFRELLEETSRELADFLDEKAETVALDIRIGSITSWTGGTLGGTTLTPILSITSVGAVTIQDVDYYQGSIRLQSSISAGTVTFTYANRCKSSGLFTDVVNAGTFTLIDFMNLRNTLSIYGSVHPDVLLMHDEDVKYLLNDSKALFVPTSSDVRAELGNLIDVRVVVSPKVPEGVAIIADSRRLGYQVIRDRGVAKENKGLDVLTEYESAYDQMRYYFYIETTFQTTQDNAIGVLVNLKSGVYPSEKASNM